MWNLFDAVRVATVAHMLRYHKKFTFSREEWDEIIDEVILQAVCIFLEHKLKEKKYCHKVSFFCNCWSCVMSCFLARCQMHAFRIGKIAGCPLRPDDYKAWPTYTKQSINPKNCVEYMHSWMKRSMSPSYLEAEDLDDYMSYLECCDEFNIPVRDTPMLRRGPKMNGHAANGATVHPYQQSKI